MESAPPSCSAGVDVWVGTGRRGCRHVWSEGPRGDPPLLSWTLRWGKHGAEDSVDPPAGRSSSHTEVPHVKLLYYSLNNSTVEYRAYLASSFLAVHGLKIKYKREGRCRRYTEVSLGGIRSPLTPQSQAPVSTSPSVQEPRHPAGAASGSARAGPGTPAGAAAGTRARGHLLGTGWGTPGSLCVRK